MRKYRKADVRFQIAGMGGVYLGHLVVEKGAIRIMEIPLTVGGGIIIEKGCADIVIAKGRMECNPCSDMGQLRIQRRDVITCSEEVRQVIEFGV